MRPADQSLQQWARTADFADPPRWGEIEAVILGEPVTKEDMDLIPPRAGARPRIVGALAYFVVGAPAAAMYASSLIGLGLVLWRTGADAAPDGWVHGLRLAFLAACGVSGATFGIWWDTRRRGVLGPVATMATGLVSLWAFVVMLSHPDTLGDTPARLLAGLAAVLGIVTCAVVLVASKPGVPRRGLRRRTPVSPEEQIRRGMRAQVLEVLVKRGVVSDREIDIPDMVEMPLGTWHELDRR